MPSRSSNPSHHHNKHHQPKGGEVSGHQFQIDSFGFGYLPAAPALDAFAVGQATFSADLQGVTAADHASVNAALFDAVDFRAWTFGPIVASATASANAQANATIANGVLSGSAHEAVTIDLSAWLPASHVMVQIEVSDTLDLAMSGKGYTGVALANDASTLSAVHQAGAGTPGTVQLGSAGTPGVSSNNFDLARFAAVVLGMTQWQLGFVAASPGESLHVDAQALRVVDAQADILQGLPGSEVLQHLAFQDTERVAANFNSHSVPAMVGHALPHDVTPGVVVPLRLA